MPAAGCVTSRSPLGTFISMRRAAPNRARRSEMTDTAQTTSLSSSPTGLFSPLAERLGLTDGRINLLADFDTAFWSIIVMVVWKVAGFTMVVLMTGLQSIPSDLQEAAKIDGANAFVRFRRITLPLMRRTIALALVLSVAGSVLAFDQFYIILRGGPRNQTLTAVYWIFNQSFVSFKLGYGAALSMV